MSKRPAARPPRKPRGESAKVTISVQERLIHNLTARCEDLVRERDTALNEATENRMHRSYERSATVQVTEMLDRERESRKGDLARLEECQAKLASTEQRFQGYQAAVMDMARPKPLIIGHNGMPLDFK